MLALCLLAASICNSSSALECFDFAEVMESRDVSAGGCTAKCPVLKACDPFRVRATVRFSLRVENNNEPRRWLETVREILGY